MDALDNIKEQKRLYNELKKSIDVELRQLRSDKLRNAKLEYAKAVLTAWNAGVQNISAIARAMGTSDRKSVYALMDLAKSVVPQSLQISKGERNWSAVVTAQGLRWTAVDVPPAWWTYEKGPDKPRMPWSGWVQFDSEQLYIVQCDPDPSPLQAEWMYGDGTLQEAVGDGQAN